MSKPYIRVHRDTDGTETVSINQGDVSINLTNNDHEYPINMAMQLENATGLDVEYWVDEVRSVPVDKSAFVVDPHRGVGRPTILNNLTGTAWTIRGPELASMSLGEMVAMIEKLGGRYISDHHHPDITHVLWCGDVMESGGDPRQVDVSEPQFIDLIRR